MTPSPLRGRGARLVASLALAGLGVACTGGDDPAPVEAGGAVTAQVDTEGLSRWDSVLVAPTDLPGGLRLESVFVNDYDNACPNVAVTYKDPAAAASATAGFSMLLHHRDCPNDLADEVGDAADEFVAGDHRGLILRGSTDGLAPGSAALHLVVVNIDGADVVVNSDLPEEDLVTAVASLEPVDASAFVDGTADPNL